MIADGISEKLPDLAMVGLLVGLPHFNLTSVPITASAISVIATADALATVSMEV